MSLYLFFFLSLLFAFESEIPILPNVSALLTSGEAPLSPRDPDQPVVVVAAVADRETL